MRGITGVELGPDSCVLVRSGRDGSRTAVSSARIFGPGDARATRHMRDSHAFANALRQAREEAGLPSHARVVAWGVPGAPSQLDLEHLPEIGPLVAAGFAIDGIVSPAQAMARLVNARKIDTSRMAVAVVSLNTHGAAIAIVSNGEAISARTFAWPLGRPFAGRRSELLERYLIVSQIAPQLRHVIDLVRPVYSVSIASILVCGNLPDLRSLSMLLIEEMDVEIETLDSVDLLESPDVAPADAVPSLQLAAAVSLPMQGGRPVSAPALSGAEDHRGMTALRRTSLVLALTIAGVWLMLQLGGSSPADPIFPGGIVLAAAPAATPAATPAAPAISATPATPPVSDLRPQATMGRIREKEPETPIAPVSSPAPSPVATAPATERPAAAATAPADPLPRVDGIMISGIRRVAIVGGEVVSPGDRVGSRTVVRIERDGVVLLEPTGREVHVAIRTRK
ncbi:MAG TPA: hypothetical protein VFJ02_20895 [Vicinamibacterales bacterium]|nr:hypothetical protein [Vicinamibacterales bacterium]